MEVFENLLALQKLIPLTLKPNLNGPEKKMQKINKLQKCIKSHKLLVKEKGLKELGKNY